MTINEFKAWFEGYTENIHKVPTQKQWARIVERVSDIEVEPSKCHHYYRELQPWRPWYPTWYSNTGGTLTTTLGNATSSGVSVYNVSAAERAGNSPSVSAEFELSNSTAWAMARDIGEREAARDNS